MIVQHLEEIEMTAVPVKQTMNKKFSDVKLKLNVNLKKDNA